MDVGFSGSQELLHVYIFGMITVMLVFLDDEQKQTR